MTEKKSRCPRCRTFSGTVEQLRRHLIWDHGRNPVQAAHEAQQNL